MAHQLQSQNEECSVVLIDSWPPIATRPLTDTQATPTWQFARDLWGTYGKTLDLDGNWLGRSLGDSIVLLFEDAQQANWLQATARIEQFRE